MQNVLFCDKKSLKDLIRSHHSRIATMHDEMVKFKFRQLLHKTKLVKTAEKLSVCKAQDSPIPGHLLSLPTIIQRLSKHNCLLRKVRRNTLLNKYMQPNLLGRFNLHPDEVIVYSFPHHHQCASIRQSSHECYSKASVLVSQCSCQGNLDVL